MIWEWLQSQKQNMARKIDTEDVGYGFIGSTRDMKNSQGVFRCRKNEK